MTRTKIQTSHDTADPDLERAAALARGLFPHQVEGLAYLLARRRAILADDMGLGKTRQAIVALRQAAPDGPYLVVCPASVKRNWEVEIRSVTPDATVSIVHGGQPKERAAPASGWTIVNYDLLPKTVDWLERVAWAGIVFDEAHYLKNHTSQRSKLAQRIAGVGKESGPLVYALTGTPLTNRPRDLFPLLKLVDHPLGRSFLAFAKRYCAAEHNGYGWVTTGASGLDELATQLHGVMLRRTKAEVLDLPPKLRTWLEVDVPADTARREMVAVVSLLVRGRPAAGVGPERSTARVQSDRTKLFAAITTVRRKLAAAKITSTLDLVRGAVDQGEKVLVFSCFDEPVKKIAEHFGDAAVILTGATPTAKRQGIVDRFQSDDGVRVFVANIQAGGVGLNLTAARQVVFNDLDWVPANHWQAEDRAYRIGQTSTVNVSYLVASDTIDEFVRSVLDVKAGLVDAVVEGAAFDAGGDVLGELERAVAALSPGLADTSSQEVAEEVVARVLAAAKNRTREADAAAVPDDRLARYLDAVPKEILHALATALAGPKFRGFRITSSSRKDVVYALEVDTAGDVVCSCPGFEYRGMCSHARVLKTALASGRPAPSTYVPVLGA